MKKIIISKVVIFSFCFNAVSYAGPEILRDSGNSKDVKLKECATEYIGLQKLYCNIAQEKTELPKTCRSRQQILEDVASHGHSLSSFLNEVKHQAIMTQQPAPFVDKIATELQVEISVNEKNAIIQKQENDISELTQSKTYWIAGSALISAIVTGTVFCIGSCFSSKK